MSRKIFLSYFLVYTTTDTTFKDQILASKSSFEISEAGRQSVLRNHLLVE